MNMFMLGYSLCSLLYMVTRIVVVCLSCSDIYYPVCAYVKSLSACM